MVRAAEAFGVDLVDVFGAGGARGKPAAVRDDLDAADRRIVAGRAIEHAVDRLAGQFGDLDLLRRELRQFLLLLGRRRRLDAVGRRLAEVAGEIAIQLAGIAAGARGDLGRQQRRHDAVLVGRPDAAVAPQKGRAGAFLAAEAQRAVEQAVDEPFEADRHLVELAAQPRGDAIDHGAADHGLADRGVLPPARPIAKQIIDRDGEIVVGRHQAGAGVTMPCRSWSVSQAKAMSYLILQADQAAAWRRTRTDPCGCGRPNPAS